MLCAEAANVNITSPWLDPTEDRIIYHLPQFLGLC